MNWLPDTELFLCYTDIAHPRTGIEAMIDSKAMVRALMEKCSESRSYIFDYNIVRWLVPLETCGHLPSTPASLVASTERASIAIQMPQLSCVTTNRETILRYIWWP